MKFCVNQLHRSTVTSTRLADIIVIQAIRAWIEGDPAAAVGWFGALRDPQIGRAITVIHRNPGRDWTVASLARELNMSRSSFAARFTALVGEPVMAYLTRWRMQIAIATLRDESTTVALLAGRLGYQSEAAFARMFKRHTGVAPGSVRRLPDPFASSLLDVIGTTSRDVRRRHSPAPQLNRQPLVADQERTSARPATHPRSLG